MQPRAHLTAPLLASCCVWLSAAALHAQQPADGRDTIAASTVATSLREQSTRAFALTPALSHASTNESRIEEPRIPPKVVASLYSGLIATQALDVHSTLRAIDAGARETNGMVRWATTSAPVFVAFKAATTAGTLYVIDRLRRRHPKPALFLLVGLNSASAIVVAHNYAAGNARR